MSKRNNIAEERTFIPVTYEWVKAIKRLNQKDGYALIMAIFDYAIYGTIPGDNGMISIIFDTAIKPFADSMEIEYYTKAIKGAYRHDSNKDNCLPFSEWFAEWLADLSVEDGVKQRLKRLESLDLDYTENANGNGAEQNKNKSDVDAYFNQFTKK